MKNNKQLLLALALAFSGFAVHAASLDLKLPEGGSSSNSTAPANGAGNDAALPVTATPAARPQPVSAPANPAPAAKVGRAEPDVAPMAKITASAKTVAPVSKPAPAATTPPAPIAATPAVSPALKPTPSQPVSAESALPLVPFGHDKTMPVTQPAATTPAATPTVATAVPGAANPFTGKALSLEGRQREIEAAKLDSELLGERLKQANMLADLTYVPLKKQAEIASLPNLQKTQPKEAAPTTASTAPQPTPTLHVKKVTKKKGASKPVTTEPPATPVTMPQAPPAITVSSISINGTNASAVLEAQGNVMSARSGESTPFGQVRVIDAHTVMVGTQRLTVRDSVLSRMVVSDPVYVDPKNTPVVAVPHGATPASMNNLPPLPVLPPPPKALMR